MQFLRHRSNSQHLLVMIFWQILVVLTLGVSHIPGEIKITGIGIVASILGPNKVEKRTGLAVNRGK